jgi:hypothetical protein
LDSFAVKLCPLGHLSWIVMYCSPLRTNGNQKLYRSRREQ